jgi:hypothetical protein
MSNLVELMAEIMPDIKPNSTLRAERVLKLVKEHIGEVAKICDYPNCHFGQESYMMMGEVHYRDCPQCKGSGVIPRTEGDVNG